jgi:hypothetical protein
MSDDERNSHLAKNDYKEGDNVSHASNIITKLKKYGFIYVYSFSEIVKNKQCNYKEIFEDYMHAGIYALVDLAKNRVLYVGRTGRTLVERINDYLFQLNPK